MKNLELENLGLLSISSIEMKDLDGGILMSPMAVYRFAIGEVADFIQGVGEGFWYAVR